VVCEEILSALGKRMAELEQAATSVNLSRQVKVVKKAEEYMRHHLQNPIKVSEICRMTNTSERVLEYAFNKIYGMSPKRFLTVLRLHKARQLLISANAHEVNVTNIAMSCGFRHMGRFSAEYRKMYDELPSQTLRPD
jgi:AraC family ethanolamine operon transcriptional activator